MSDNNNPNSGNPGSQTSGEDAATQPDRARKRATSKKSTHAYIDAEYTLVSFRQPERMSNSAYLEKLKSLVEVFEHLGGEPGTSAARVQQYLGDPNEKDLDILDVAHGLAREEYIAVNLIIKSDPKRYRTLIDHLANNYKQGNDGYPTTISRAYNMLENYRALQQAHGAKTSK